jgi:hypothetical protein
VLERRMVCRRSRPLVVARKEKTEEDEDTVAICALIA